MSQSNTDILIGELVEANKSLREICKDLKDMVKSHDEEIRQLKTIEAQRRVLEKDKEKRQEKKDKFLTRVLTILSIVAIVSPIIVGVFSFKTGYDTYNPNLEQHQFINRKQT